MPANNEELKEKMMVAAEAVVSELVKQAEEKEDITLSEIERLVRAAGQQVMERLTTKLIEAKGNGEGQPACRECGQTMRSKGRKARHVITETGEVRLERDYYYCAHCRRGLFPPG